MCQLMFLNKHVIVMLQSNVHDFLSIDEICVFEAFTAQVGFGSPWHTSSFDTILPFPSFASVLDLMISACPYTCFAIDLKFSKGGSRIWTVSF